MITFSVLSDSAVKLTFDGNSHYLQDGEITVPKNSLALVKDESELITFIKAATGDAYLSFHIEDTNFASYTELENWYKANMVSAYGGGGGGGNASITSVTQAQYEQISGSADPSTLYVISDAPAVDISNYYTKTEVDDLLLNVEIDVDTAITQDSTNAVEGGAIYDALQGKVSDIILTSLNNKCEAIVQTKGSVTNYPICFSRINGESFAVFNSVQAKNFELVETSAVTTSMTSGSTDSQVPSAKAVYDAMGGLTLLPISQADYDLLPTKDPNTLYIITNVVNNS